MRRANQITGIVGLALSAALLWGASKMDYAIEYSPAAGFLPFWLSIIFAILSLALLLTATFQGKKKGEEAKAFLPDKSGRKRSLFFIAALTLCILLIGKLGFLITCFLFTLFVLVGIEKYKLKTGLISSFCMVVGLYALFVLAMNVPLPKGFLGF